jgi:hypothetical protein
MRKAEAKAAWQVAREKADVVIRFLEATGDVPAVVIPNSEEGMAKAVLREALVLALSPYDHRTKAAAMRTVLMFTKSLPDRATRQMITAEGWLSDAQDRLSIR